MKVFVKTLLFLFLFQTSGIGQSAKKVLFVGNSYTYFWNLPQHVEEMAKATDVNLIARQSTSGGVNLGMHWRGERNLQSKQLIQEGDFDYVVLQDHSLRSIEAPDSLQHFGELFGKIIKEQGGEPIIYMTWARAKNPMMQPAITAGYQKLAAKLNAKIAPVGPAWAKALAMKPTTQLFDPDGSHPSPVGTYLTACVFYKVLTGNSPVGLPNRLITTDKDGEKLYLTIQDGLEAQFLQAVAEEAVNEFNQN